MLGVRIAGLITCIITRLRNAILVKKIENDLVGWLATGAGCQSGGVTVGRLLYWVGTKIISWKKLIIIMLYIWRSPHI